MLMVRNNVRVHITITPHWLYFTRKGESSILVVNAHHLQNNFPLSLYTQSEESNYVVCGMGIWVLI